MSWPVETRVHDLPFDRLTWKAFEHLCLALVDLDERVELGHMYGVEGEEQDGIDLFGDRLDNDRAIVFQCKRVEEFGPAKIRRMVDKFLGKTNDGQPLKDKDGQPIPDPVDDEGNSIEPWHRRADTFVLCISRPLNTTLQQNAWRQTKERLKREGIQAELWDPSVLGRKLRNAPEIVDIYFSRPWVAAFCGPEAAAGLGQLQENDRAALRKLLDMAEGVSRDVQALRTEGIHLSADTQTQLLDGFRQQVLPHLAPQPVSTDDDPLSRELDLLRSFLNAGAVEAAQAKLGELRPQAEAASPRQHARLLRLAGALHYHQEHHAAAADCYLRAFDLDDQSDSALLYKGLGHLLKDEPHLALGYLDLARRRAPEREDILAMYAVALHLLGRTAEFDALEATLVPEQVEFGAACARQHMLQKDTARMRQVLAVLNSGPHAAEPHVRLLNAKAILQEIMAANARVHGDLRTRKVLANPETPVALAHLDAAVEAFRNPKHLLALRLEALNARQVLLSLLGEDRRSLDDGLAALRLDRDQTGVLFDVALVYLKLDRPQDALRLLDEYGEAVLDEVRPARAIFAAASRRAGDPERALELVAPLQADADVDRRVEALEERVRALIELKRLPEARAAVEVETARHAGVELCRALVETAAGDDGATRAAYQEALTLAADFERTQIAFQYAEYLRQQDDRKGAADLMLPVSLETLPSTWLELAIETLYAGGQSEAARAALRERRARGEPERRSTCAVEAHLATVEGDLASAIALYESMLRRWPGHARTLVEAAAAYSRLGNRARVQALLEQVLPLKEVAYPTLQQGAEVARNMNLGPLARTLGYRALRLGFDDEETHVQFFNVIQAFPDQQTYRLVKPETAVELRAPDRDPWWVVLTADPDPQRSRGEYALNDPLAGLLLGQPVGATVTLPSSEAYMIQQVVSKYTNAERVWLQEGRQLFPTSERVRVMRARDLEVLPSGVWDMLKAKHDQGEILMRLVREHHFPIALLHLGRREAEVRFWDYSLERHAEFMVNALDEGDDQVAAQAANSPDLVLHSSALAVLTHARCLRRLLEKRTLLVTRQTLDDLNRAVRDARVEVAKAPRLSLYYAGGRLVYEEEPREVAQARLKRLESLAHTVRTRAKIIPVMGILDFYDQHDGWEDLLPTVSTFLAARQRKVPVLCDDLNLVRLARIGLFGPPVVGTTSVLLMDQLQRQGVWTAAQHTEAVLNFAAIQQTVLPGVTKEMLPALFAREHLTFGWATAGVVRSLTYESLTVNAVATNVALLAKYAFVESPLDMTRERWFRQVLDWARENRNLFDLRPRPALQRALREAMDLMPLQLHLALDVFERWWEGAWAASGGQPLTDVPA